MSRLLYALIYGLIFAIGYAIGAIYQIHEADNVRDIEVQIANEFEQHCYDLNGTYKFGECQLNWEVK